MRARRVPEAKAAIADNGYASCLRGLRLDFRVDGWLNGVTVRRRSGSREKLPMLKVYGRANSINVRKVLWMLGELGLPYEREDWGRGYRPTADPVFRTI